MPQVNTVLGPISPDELGKTLIHEHFLFGMPGAQADETMAPFDREAAINEGIKMAERLKTHGVKTVVDCTTNDCGRDPGFLKEISEKTGVNIVCSSGYYTESEGSLGYYGARMYISEDVNQEIYEMFEAEAMVGIARTGIKSGVFKLASGPGNIADSEKIFFVAAARASKEYGIPIITHTSEGQLGPEQADLLLAEGADPKRVIIGHICGSTDMEYFLKVLEKGVYIAFDRFGIQGCWGGVMDSRRVAILLGLLGLGYANRILLSHDYVNYFLGRPNIWSGDLKTKLGKWHYSHIFEDILPEIRKAGVTEKQIDTMMVENPRNIFCGE